MTIPTIQVEIDGDALVANLWYHSAIVVLSSVEQVSTHRYSK
jgi:hypothetical protein